MLHPKTDLVNQVKVSEAGSQADSSGDTIILTAGATEDAVEVTGLTIDRLGYESCVFALGSIATLANTKTISFGVKYQTSADDSTWDTAVVLQAATVLDTGDGVATTFHGAVELGLKLSSLKRYIRFNITPDMSATSVDTAIWSAVCILAGPRVLPAA